MSWFQVVPVALASAAWLFGLGIPLTYLLGLRGIAAWGLAPALGIAITATTAVIAGKIGVAWSIPLVLVAEAIAVALAAVVALVLRRIAPPRVNDPRRVRLAAGLGLVPVVAIGWYILVRGMASPDQLNQSYDAIFHYNALAYILDEGNASSLSLSTLGNKTTPPAFYPAGWHAVASLVAMTTGAPIVVVANLFSGVIAILVWPTACVLLVRQIVGPSVAAMSVTGLISTTFTAFPWGLLGFGVLWPNLLAMSLVPAGVALVLSITSLAREDVVGRRRAIAFLPVVLVACGLAHPNAVFSFGVIALFPIAAGLYRWARRMRAEGRTSRGLVGVGLVVVVVLAIFQFVSTTPALAPIRTQHWPPFETPARAVGEVLLNATNGRNALWALSALMLVGIYSAWRLEGKRWLVTAFVGTAFLYVLTAAINRQDTQKFTGYWYNDSYRLATMLPVVGVPLVVLGIALVAEKLLDRTADLRLPERFSALRDTTAAGVLVLIGLLLLSRLFYAGLQAHTLASVYTEPVDSANGTLVDPREEAFTPQLAAEVPKDAIVANNPWDGSGIMLSEVDRKPLFRHVDIAWSNDQRYVANYLDDAATDPLVCEAANRLGVQYLFVGNKTFWKDDRRVKAYPGIVDPGPSDAFELVASNGPIKLYKLVGCQTPAQRAGK